MESLSPNLFVNNIIETTSFYRQLGFEIVMTVPEEGDPDWVMMTNGSVTFMFQTFSNLGEALPEVKRSAGGSLLFYIKLKGLRDLHERIKDKAKVIVPINKTFYGATEFAIVDNNGYVLTFAEDEG